MKAIILAAGRGSRMGSLTQDQPKCLTVLHGRALIEWQMQALRGAGISEIGIVRGYLAHEFRMNARYFENARWEETNMVMSLAAAHEWLEAETCMVSYSDIVYNGETVDALLSASADIAITYDANWLALWRARFSDPLSDAETFRVGDDGMLLEIGNRAHCVEDIQGQYMGLLKFTPAGWRAARSHLERHDAGRRDRMDMTALLRGLLEQGAGITAIPAVGRWYEVDSESDLRLYETMPPLTASLLKPP